MLALLKAYAYPAQQDTIELFAPNFVRVKFGSITLNEEDNTKETHWVKETFEDIKRHTQGQVLKVLVDFTSIDSGEYNSKESNTLYRQMLADDAIQRVAVYGLHTGWQLLIDLLRVFLPHKLKTFTTEEQALQWLEIKI